MASSAVLASCTPAALQRVTPGGTERQEVLVAGGQRLDDLQLGHLGGPVEDRRPLHVGQHVELRRRRSSGVVVAVGTVAVRPDTIGQSAESLSGLGEIGVRQPDRMFRPPRLLVGLPAPTGSPDGVARRGERGLHVSDPERTVVEHGGRQHRVGARGDAGGKSSTRPAPPEAISGTSTTARTAAIILRSKPAVVPSASIELSRISPTPRSTPGAPTPRRPARRSSARRGWSPRSRTAGRTRGGRRRRRPGPGCRTGG